MFIFMYVFMYVPVCIYVCAHTVIQVARSNDSISGRGPPSDETVKNISGAADAMARPGPHPAAPALDEGAAVTEDVEFSAVNVPAKRKVWSEEKKSRKREGSGVRRQPLGLVNAKAGEGSGSEPSRKKPRLL